MVLSVKQQPVYRIHINRLKKWLQIDSEEKQEAMIWKEISRWQSIMHRVSNQLRILCTIGHTSIEDPP